MVLNGTELLTDGTRNNTDAVAAVSPAGGFHFKYAVARLNPDATLPDLLTFFVSPVVTTSA